MFQERYNRIVLPFFFVTDVLIVVSVFTLILESINNLWWPSIIVSLIWAFPSLYYKSYRAPRVYSNWAALRPIFFTWMSFCLLYTILAIFDLLPTYDINSHVLLLLIIGLMLHLISLGRFRFFHQYRLKGKNIRNVLFIGSILDKKIFEKLKKDCLHYGYHISSFIEDINQINNDLEDILIRGNINLVFLREMDENVSILVSEICDQHGVRLKLLLNMDPSTGRKAGLDIIGGFPVMDVRKEPLLYLGNRFSKRTVDIIMSSLSIICVLTWLPIIVKLAQVFSYPGPLLFVQKRIGRDGNIFKLYKFRTMHHTEKVGQAKEGQSKKTSEGDSRVPWFGQMLRKTNLDEYPQFFNVFIGSMSTVGPRPHMVGEDRELAEKVIYYRVRRFVKPGITGWAAINGYRGGTNDMELMSKRTKYDIWYLENWSLWLDVKIITMTIWQMLTFRIPKAY